jgi:signal transduction histidine kinase
VAQDLGFMNGAADKMSLLLSELLDLSRVGRLVTPSVETSFADLVREATELNAGGLAQSGIELRVAPAAAVLFGDRARFVEIWQNLVENAVKFMGNQPKPLVALGARDAGGDIVFYVQDNGRGIDPRYHQKIFGLFDKLNADSEGTGLGLALVKRIVQLYEGKMWVESAGEEEGATFCFTLPAALEKGDS